MTRLHFSTHIDASPEKVWEVMLSDDTYRQWTTAFMPGSYFEGSWEQGSEIRFIGPNPNEPGTLSGIVGRIIDNQPQKRIEIEYFGFFSDGKVVTDPEVVGEWLGAKEIYEFQLDEEGKGTKLDIYTDLTEDMQEDMAKAWPEALESLKQLCLTTEETM